MIGERQSKKSIGKADALKKRMTGIEPASKAWEAFILPMNYIRIFIFFNYTRKLETVKSFFQTFFAVPAAYKKFGFLRIPQSFMSCF